MPIPKPIRKVNVISPDEIIKGFPKKPDLPSAKILPPRPTIPPYKHF